MAMTLCGGTPARIRCRTLTGYGRDEDRKAALAAGFDGHLVKPVSVRALQEVVAQSASGMH